MLAAAGLWACPSPCADAANPPRDIVLVLDVSRSMDDAFPRVIAGLETFLAAAGPDDTLTLSTFGDGVKFIARRRTLAPDPRAAARQVLEGLAPTDRFTNITYAVDRALSEIIRMGEAPGRRRELILLTDGKHNPPPGGQFPVPTFDALAEKAGRLPADQWYIRYVVLGSEDDPNMTTFVRRFGGEATMLRHVLDERLAQDLADTLHTAWLPAAVTVEAVRGGVLVERVGEEAVVPDPGASLREGDRLLLGPDGYAIVTTVGGARFGLNPDTRWTLAQARRDPATGQVRVRGAVRRGVVLATAADVPLVQIGLAGLHGAIHTAEGTVGLSENNEGTTVAATEAGASILTYGVPPDPPPAAELLRPVARPPGAGPTAALRDPAAVQGDPEALPGGAYTAAQFLGDWRGVQLLDREWQARFTGWRSTLETGVPLSAVPGAILVARQPPRLTDLVITAEGEFEGDVLSDDDALIILQTDAGLRYFPRSTVLGVSFAAFPLSSGRVEEVTGRAEFRRQGRSDRWKALIVGTKLRPGDMIRTGDQSRVILTVAGQVVVAIKPGSTFTLKDARRDNGTGDVRVRVSLDAGQLWNDVGTLASSRSRYIVETPQATSGVRGTVFTVVYDRQTEETTVATVSGAVQVVEKEETLRQVEVTASRQASIEPDQALVTETIEPETVREWEAQADEFEERREILESEYPPVNREPVRAALYPSLPEPQRAGRVVTWTAHYPAAPDTTYEYEFALRGPGTEYQWAVTRAFAPEVTWDWDTRRQDGRNLVRVRVRRADGGPMDDATTVVNYTIRPSRAGTVLLGLGAVWVLALAGMIGTQLAFKPRAGAQQRLRVTDAPQGLPRPTVPLPPMNGLRWIHEIRMGRATEADLTLGDERLALTQCRVRRTRFGPWLRTTLIVEPGAPVYVDGVRTEPGAHPLRPMTHLRLGEYAVRYETAERAPQYEVVCRDGRIVRGTAPVTDILTVPVLILQPTEAGVPAYTLPFAGIEQIRCYRSPAEDDRMRGKPGNATVGGPVVRVWFEDSGDMLTGRLERAEDAEEGRFRIYTEETNGLGCVLIVAMAAKKIKVLPGTERPPTFTPKDRVVVGRSRLGLAGPGPTAVSQADIKKSLERMHETREDEKDSGASPPRAPETERDAAPKPAKKPAPKRPPPKPPGEQDRYINRRGKPRI